VQRVSEKGIDFVMKKGSGTCDALANGRPIAILHLQGRYVPGETAEQWRGEGSCKRLPLDDMLDRLPHYTITGMVSSKRIEKEKGALVKDLQVGTSEVSIFVLSGCVTCALFVTAGWSAMESVRFLYLMRSNLLSNCFLSPIIDQTVNFGIRIDWPWRTRVMPQKSCRKQELPWKMEKSRRLNRMRAFA
jgi:hypothetical protein